ncbi:hypothetical protein PTSG_05550 [Salpingoeca rosetta]|uniref:RING-type domain-containing protein n=1 Tax=Salpingoeca rosetta (strain ATCC 50818 / BSB-021) TaxID=946362 RepID=F2UBI9_SALR5|nr:uncharacterized protein PTSG_05550 [Salpingoeca rosetta]EGD73855.1 hypothetical protein PTSG_05550 [Salpingoeca rosetta]|eukprot:XP_004993418.1 hypothetical protein PTSG_05550 [Salpingoeca rosetta]
MMTMRRNGLVVRGVVLWLWLCCCGAPSVLVLVGGQDDNGRDGKVGGEGPSPAGNAASSQDCEATFLAGFEQCDSEHNQIYTDEDERQQQAAAFARCVVDLTTEFVDCTGGDFSLLDKMIAGIKERAMTDPIPAELVQFKATLVQKDTPADLKQVIEEVNRKKRGRAEAAVRRRLVHKAEANTLAILMAYKKVITRVRSEDVLSSIRDDSESTQQFDNVYQKLSEPTTGATGKDGTTPATSSFTTPSSLSLFFSSPAAAVATSLAAVAAAVIFGRWTATAHAPPRPEHRDDDDRKAATKAEKQRHEQQLASERRQHKRELEQLQHLLSSAQQKEEAATRTNKTQERELQRLRGKIDQLQANLKGKAEAANKLEATVTAHNATIRANEETISRLKGEVKKLNSRMQQQDKKLVEEKEISTRLTKQNESLSAQLLLVQRDTSVTALKRRIEHLRHALQQTQDLLVIAQVKEKIRQASARLQVASPMLQQLCKSCMERPVTVAADPCGHACLCRVCATDAQSCPVCNEPVKRQIFLVF